MKVHFQIFGDILLFVGWLAPAYGKDEVNSNGISPWQGWGWTKSIPKGSHCRMACAMLPAATILIFYTHCPPKYAKTCVIRKKSTLFVRKGAIIPSFYLSLQARQKQVENNH